VVLDPFSGSATTGAVALELGRNYIGIDLNEDYLPLAEARLLGEAPPEQAKEDPDSIIIDLFRE
jgi:site-specific DNA-methyltransferase (cytosine-N4-specific)